MSLLNINSMKFTLNTGYFSAFIFLFLIEICIVIVFKEGFVRHTMGDYLVVILLYCLFKSFITAKQLPVALVTLGISYTVEFLQLTSFLSYLKLDHKRWANLLFGNTFSLQDVLAYTLGIVTVIVFESWKKAHRQSA